MEKKRKRKMRIKKKEIKEEINIQNYFYKCKGNK